MTRFFHDKLEHFTRIPSLTSLQLLEKLAFPLNQQATEVIVVAYLVEAAK